MEYSIQNLDKAIFYYLSCNKDVPKSVNQIFNGLTIENIVPELDNRENHSLNVIKLKSLCNIINDKFKPIYKIYPKGTLHLVYSDTEPDDSKYNTHDYVEETTENYTEDINYDEIIKDLSCNPQHYPYIQINDTLDGNDTPLHMCCNLQSTKYLNALLENYEVDLDIKNSSNKRALDLAIDNNMTNHIILLKDYHHQKVLNNLKNVNHKLQSEYSMQTEQALYLREQNINKTEYLVTLWTLMVSSHIIINNYFDSVIENFESKDYLEKNWILFSFSLLILQSFFSTNLLRNISLKNWIIFVVSIISCYWHVIYNIYIKLLGPDSFYDNWIVHDKLEL